ncbi:MAG: glycosyltransferase family 2 protein [bacterium]
MKKLSVIIPAYNEERTLAEIVRRVRAIDLSPLEIEVIVVDNNSKDSTYAIASGIPGIRVIKEKTPGKGAAVRAGFAAAAGDMVIIQDADLEYEPKDYASVIAPILSGKVKAVVGVRTIIPEDAPPRGVAYDIGNTLITLATNILYGGNAEEYTGCYKAFTKELIDSIQVREHGFAYEHELVCKVLKRGNAVASVPIHYYPRSYDEGKKINWKDGFRILWAIIKYRFVD